MKLVFAACLAALLVASSAGAHDMTVHAGTDDQPYTPKIDDIMAAQQMRHIKLWFAGRAGDWPLADYEIDKLKDAFDEVNKQLGGDTVEKAIGPGISALEKAVEAKDRGAFTNAFDQLTAGCNNCHQTLDHAYIAIQRPVLLPYSDQSFATPK
jgi:hypothetical protein